MYISLNQHQYGSSTVPGLPHLGWPQPGSVVRRGAAGSGAGGGRWGSARGRGGAGTGAADATAGGMCGGWRHWTLGKNGEKGLGGFWRIFNLRICIED